MDGLTPQALWTTIRRGRLIQVLAVYLGSSFLVLEAVDILTARLGLPDWVFPGAVVLLLMGLPIILTTALVQSGPSPKLEAEAGHSVAPTPEAPRPTTATDVAAVANHWLTWRKAIAGGVLAFAAWGIFVSGYMAMRVLGIGPVGSLVAAGVLDPRDRIILAEFENNTTDSLLASAVTEAFRVDLSQSPLVKIVQPGYVNSVLIRMERDPNTPVDLALAREVAIRGGLKAVIAGEINGAGTGYVLSARLISADAGDEIAAFRETADDSTAIIAAIDRLSKELRERVGESLKSIRANEPLQRVTTASLEALRKYSQAVRAIELEGDQEKGIALLEEAIALDTAFAMAYRKLGAHLANNFQERARAADAMTKAYEHRGRLTDRERYRTLGTYYEFVTGETQQAVTAYRTLLDIYPDDDWAINNLGNLYLVLRDYSRAEELYRRAIDIDSFSVFPYTNAVIVQVAQGEFEEAETTLERLAGKVPGHPQGVFFSANVAAAQGDYDGAEAQIRTLRDSSSGSLSTRSSSDWYLANLARVRGKLAEAESYSRDAMAVAEQRGLPSDYLFSAGEVARLDVQFRGRAVGGLETLANALERYPLGSLAPLDRPYTYFATLYAAADRPDLARASIAELEAEIAPDRRQDLEPWRHNALGWIALAEGRPRDAVPEFRQFDQTSPPDFCGPCALALLGRAYDEAGEPDSAAVVYERYLNTPGFNRFLWDSYQLALVYERLGALYEESGDPEKAIYYYGRLVELWKNADRELQPRVEAARRAIRALSPDR